MCLKMSKNKLNCFGADIFIFKLIHFDLMNCKLINYKLIFCKLIYYKHINCRLINLEILII